MPTVRLRGLFLSTSFNYLLSCIVGNQLPANNLLYKTVSASASLLHSAELLDKLREQYPVNNVYHSVRTLHIGNYHVGGSSITSTFYR